MWALQEGAARCLSEWVSCSCGSWLPSAHPARSVFSLHQPTWAQHSWAQAFPRALMEVEGRAAVLSTCFEESQPAPALLLCTCRVQRKQPESLTVAPAMAHTSVLRGDWPLLIADSSLQASCPDAHQTASQRDMGRRVGREASVSWVEKQD